MNKYYHFLNLVNLQFIILWSTNLVYTSIPLYDMLEMF